MSPIQAASRAVFSLLSGVGLLAGQLLVPAGVQEAAAAAVLRVPQGHRTIQSAIDAAAGGDTVLVSPGTYMELIDFHAKEITVQSTSGPASTVIDGNRAGTVVTMAANPDQRPALRGFTIRNGWDGGVVTHGGPALIEGNWVSGNLGCSGIGISALFSSATIRRNIVSDNRYACSGGSGGGVLIQGAGTANVLNNLITGNRVDTDGGGVALNGAGSPTVAGNVISYNTAGIGKSGGGIFVGNASDALITNNIIFGNGAFRGAGIYWLVPSGRTGPNVVNNTIAHNTAVPTRRDLGRGSAVFADGYDATTRLTNNILVGSGPEAVLDCGDFNDLNPPLIAYNDIFNAGSGPSYGGICVDQTGQSGNISADPLIIDSAAGNFHLQAGSPAVDTGLDAAAPATDIDGQPRPFDGNGDAVSIVDIGADEVRTGDTTPPTITCTATPNALRPPNHELQPVSIEISSSDDSGAVTLVLVSVTSSQPDSAFGPHDVANDIQAWTAGGDDRSGLFRAELFMNPRTYTLTYQAQDPAGNSATCQATVRVPN